jgi:zinc protease
VILTKKKSPVLAAAYQKFLKAYKKSFLEAKKSRTVQKTIKSKIKKIKWTPRSLEKQCGVLKLKSGANFIYYTNYDSPVISLKLACLGGQRAESPSQLGITELISRTWVSDTKRFKEADLHNKMDSLAAHIGAFGGKNTLGLSLTALNPFFEEAFDIFTDVLREPLFKKEVLDREVNHIIEDIKNRADNPAQICMRNFAENMFPNHPYGFDPLGNKDNFSNFNSNVLKQHLKNLVVSKNMDIVMVGDFEVKKWSEIFNKLTQDLSPGKPFHSQFPATKILKPIQIYGETKKEQSHIVVGYTGLKFVDEDRYVLQVVQSLLAGQGGRLFFELRDKESLAYSVSPMRMEGIDTGYMGAYIACSPEKATKAIDMLQKEFKKLIDTPVEMEELNRAKKYIIGRHDIDLQKNSSIGSSLIFDHIYGLPFDETFNFSKKIQAVSSNDVQRVSKQIFSQNAVISVVGAQRPW